MITLYYESRFGLARGAIYWNGLPQLYAEGLEMEPSVGVLGTRSVARLKKRAGSMLFLTMADGDDGVLEGPEGELAKLNEGAAVEIEIIAESRGDGQKLARGGFIAVAEGEPRRLSSVVSLKDRLLERARNLIGNIPVEVSRDAEALGEAKSQALDPSGALSNGGFMSVEPTSALIACDVDSHGTELSLASTSRAMAKACNEAAVKDIARRLRLSGYAGLVVIDLIGKRHDFDRLKGLLFEGFAAEAPRIIVAPIGKFGTLEFVRPWGACPFGDDFKILGNGLYLLFKAIELSEQDHTRIIVIRGRESDIAFLRKHIAGSLDPLAPMLRLEVAAKSEVIAL